MIEHNCNFECWVKDSHPDFLSFIRIIFLKLQCSTHLLANLSLELKLLQLPTSHTWGKSVICSPQIWYQLVNASTYGLKNWTEMHFVQSKFGKMCGAAFWPCITANISS